MCYNGSVKLARLLCAPPAMVAHAVPLTAPAADPRLSRFAQFWCNIRPSRINTSKSVSKQTTLTPFRINTCEKQAGWGRCAFLPSSNLSVVACRKDQVLSFHTLAHSLALSCTFLHSRKTQPVSFQLIPHFLPKNTGVGISVFAERTTPQEVSRQDLSRPTSLLRYLLTSLLPETATPFPQRWGQLRKGRTVFRREDRVDRKRR